MSVTAIALLILDLLDMGIRINSKMREFTRTAIEEGRNITAAELLSLADETDDSYERAKALYDT